MLISQPLNILKLDTFVLQPSLVSVSFALFQPFYLGGKLEITFKFREP